MAGKTVGGHTYYACELATRHGPTMTSRWPGHPNSLYVREDNLLDSILDVIATRVLGPDRRALLAADLTATDQDALARWQQQRTALRRRLDEQARRKARLQRILEEEDDPDGTLFADIRARRTELDQQERAIRAELAAHTATRPASLQTPDLLDALPVLVSRLEAAPPPILRELSEALRLHVRYDRRTNHATCQITLTDDTLPRLHTAITALPSDPDRTPAANGRALPMHQRSPVGRRLHGQRRHPHHHLREHHDGSSFRRASPCRAQTGGCWRTGHKRSGLLTWRPILPTATSTRSTACKVSPMNSGRPGPS
jgi:hypothetical protein